MTPFRFRRRSTPETVCQLHQILDDGAAQAIADAVTEAEHLTSAEIIVRLAALTPDGPSRALAESEFCRLGLADLPVGNGVLIYVSLNRHIVEIVVGPEAARQIDQDIWNEAVKAVTDGFRHNNARSGILSAISIITPPLTTAFPACPTDTTNLPNISEDP